MNGFDLLALAVLGMAVVMGAIRGGVRGMVGAGSVILGAIAALWARPIFQPWADQMVESEWARGPFAIAMGFALAYLVLRLLGEVIVRSIKDTPGLGLADRLVGAGFGAVRAVFILGLFNIAFTTVTDGEGPAFVTEAKLYPLTEASAHILRAVTPQAKEAIGNLREGMENFPESGYDARTTPGEPKE